MKKVIGGILALSPSLLTLVLALVSWDSLLRMIAAGMEGTTGEETQNLSQYGSAAVWCVIIPLVLAALGIAMMKIKNSKGKVIGVIGGVLIAASCITILFNSFMIADINMISVPKNSSLWILITLELLAAITGIVLLSLKDKK